jgi:uncharacterized membrane protein YgcG
METTNLKKSTIVCILAILILIAGVYFGVVLLSKKMSPLDYIAQRPAGNNVHIYDNAGILGDIIESTGRYLEIIKKDYAIEAVIVTLPELPRTYTIESLAAELFSNWQIGKNTGGRGMLLLLTDKEKLIKIEVS